jgi:glycosyltransferase involved in cell wall biosynthesis
MGPVLLEHPIAWLLGAALGAVWFSRMLAAAVYMRRLPELTDAEFDASPANDSGRVPRVTIIVSARNEGEHIEAALKSLLELDYPDYEVIAVDDRSDDVTGTILDDLQREWRERGEALHHRLTVIHITELPPGWLGKTHAMWQAGQQATGDWLLFTDADVVFRADVLRRTMVYAQREQADHVVLFPTMVMKSVGERMIMAFFQSQFVFARRPWKVADPKSRDAVGVGAFNLIRREAYEQVGTYLRMRLEILDDMRLGEVVKHAGLRQRALFGRDLLRLRWIFGAFGMVRNLTKNGFAILRFNAWFAMFAVCGILVVNVGPFLGAALAHGWASAGYFVALGTIAAIYVGMSWYSEIPAYYGVLHPFGALLFCYALMRSMVLTLARGGVEWRGTSYPIAELRAFLREEPRWTWL